MKGILFKPDMHQAIREGRKTVTRRVIKPQPDKDAVLGEMCKTTPEGWQTLGHSYQWSEEADIGAQIWKPHYQVGETVYVKEAWRTFKSDDNTPPCDLYHSELVYYEASPDNIMKIYMGRLRSPLHLPSRFARTFPKITGVSAERLREIQRETKGWLKEGFNSLADFIIAWNIINPDYPYESNPYVFRYEFLHEEG